MNTADILVVSDDPELVRTLRTRSQAENDFRAVTVSSSAVIQSGRPLAFDVIVVGGLHDRHLFSRFCDLYFYADSAIILIAEEQDSSVLRAAYSHLPVVSRTGDWPGAVTIVMHEALRRMDAIGRAQRAEQLALDCKRYAALGRYFIEMRPCINDALTSVIGNADLLMLGPPSSPDEGRCQIEAIHQMALRLSEVMTRFSSLAAEMQTFEPKLALPLSPESK